MKRIKTEKNKKIWDMIDFFNPKHYSNFRPKILCSDDNPFNWGNFGCKRCNAIRDVEQKKKINLAKER